MTFEIDLDDDDIRALIAEHIVEKHGIACDPSTIHFVFTPGDGRDRLPWLTASVSVTEVKR